MNINKILNTMESVNEEGFKIERNGKIITLTSEEMSEFRYLEKALAGRMALEKYCHCHGESEFLTSVMNDKFACHDIYDDILRLAIEGGNDVEEIVIDDYIMNNFEEDEGYSMQ